MPKLNPNHPVTQQLDDEFMHKVAAVLLMKLGGRAEISLEDVAAFGAMFGGETPTLVTKSGNETMEFWLVPMSEAVKLAKEAGGMPV
ncbi:hypothetical protein DF105_01040 [Burkholderia stagnalis]|uniref:hypothetical protein n=1 Tax=Burkholderia stagnalis TaxID=1503054 RepID=UPI000F5F79E5|nr:hypothetical protein [Burkholderia stagnalis]RQZ08918.1 hypothetical protein DF105_01040 [Burkholderia stagnalis]